MYERSRILVDPKVQWTIIGRLLGHWVLFFVCLISINTIVRTLFVAGQQPIGESFWSSLRIQTPSFFVMLLLLPVFLRDTMKLSNRFAGPMYRLRTALRSVAAHQPTTAIKFRDGDFWGEAADDFNTVLGQLNALQQENAELKQQLSQKAETADV